MRTGDHRKILGISCLSALLVIGLSADVFSQGRGNGNGKGNGRHQARSDWNSRQQQIRSDQGSRRQQMESDRRSREQQAHSDWNSRQQQIRSDWNSRQQQIRSDRGSRRQQVRNDRRNMRDAGLWEGFPQERRRAERRNERRNVRYDARYQKWRNADQRSRWNRPGPGTPIWANRNYQRPAMNHYIRDLRKAQKAAAKDYRRYQREISKWEKQRERAFKQRWHRTPVLIGGPVYRMSVFNTWYYPNDRYYRDYRPVYAKNYAYDPYYYRADRAAIPGYYIDHDAGDYYYDPYDQYYGGDPYYGYDDDYADGYGYYDQMGWKEVLIRNVVAMFLGGPLTGQGSSLGSGGPLMSAAGMSGWGYPADQGYDTGYYEPTYGHHYAYYRDGSDDLDLIGLFLQQIL